MLENVAVIRRPVVDWGGKTTAGFDAVTFTGALPREAIKRGGYA
jgi:hypothetical protein